MKLRMNGDSMVTLMLQFDDYGGPIPPTTIKLVYTSSNFEIKNQPLKNGNCHIHISARM
tara:strand:- start:352 stop:528 length:177 start_codon:yes stop_codon:yes gene_type:complete